MAPNEADEVLATKARLHAECTCKDTQDARKYTVIIL